MCKSEKDEKKPKMMMLSLETLYGIKMSGNKAYIVLSIHHFL